MKPDLLSGFEVGNDLQSSTDILAVYAYAGTKEQFVKVVLIERLNAYTAQAVEHSIQTKGYSQRRGTITNVLMTCVHLGVRPVSIWSKDIQNQENDLALRFFDAMKLRSEALVASKATVGALRACARVGFFGFFSYTLICISWDSCKEAGTFISMLYTGLIKIINPMVIIA